MKKRIICAVICLALCAAFHTQETVPVYASATNMSSITSESIKEKEGQIDQAQKEKKDLQNTLSDIKKMKEQLEAERSDLKKYVTMLDNDLNVIENNIATLTVQIGMKEERIAATEKELAEAQATQEQQYESMVQRIRFIYEKGDSQFMELLMSAESFGDFLNKADYLEMVVAYDRKMYQEYEATTQYVDLCRQQLEVEKEYLDEQKAAVEAQQQELEGLIQAKNQEITERETDISNKEQAIKEYEAEIAEQNELIATLEAQVAEEKKKILAESGKVLTYDGGVFKFPLATYTRVSDDYGMRIHPTLGVEQFHNGVDFAAPKGTAIYAAYDGVVVAATYSATMGNYVMLDHGDGLYTIYMHASALYVSKDDVVTRGETIAAVGSTGRSTGNHLHFSVRLNGSYTSPWNYLSQ